MSEIGALHPERRSDRGLGLALEVLEQVARHHEGVTAAEIARAVGAPRATVYRVVNSLVRDEYLLRRADFSGFVLGARVLELASVVDAHQRRAYRGVVDGLRSSTGEAVHLMALHSAGFTVLDEDPTHPISDRAAFTADPVRSAVGHLWLTDPPVRHPPERTHRWRTSAPASDVTAIRAAIEVRGYAEQVGMLAPDRGCLAVPIRTPEEGPVGAIALSIPLSRLSFAARHIALLRGAAETLAGLDPLRGS